jgi:hypothetical protein
LLTLPVFCFSCLACLNLLFFATTFGLEPRHAFDIHELAGLVLLSLQLLTTSFVFIAASFVFVAASLLFLTCRLL